MNEQCRAVQDEIAAAWPEASGVPATALAHVRACPACAAELEALRRLCARTSCADGRALSWSKILPASYWTRLGTRLRGVLRGKPSLERSWLWAPAFALTALALAVFLRRPEPRIIPPVEAPWEAVENADMLEHLDLLEDWDRANAAAERGGKS